MGNSDAATRLSHLVRQAARQEELRTGVSKPFLTLTAVLQNWRHLLGKGNLSQGPANDSEHFIPQEDLGDPIVSLGNHLEPFSWKLSWFYVDSKGFVGHNLMIKQHERDCSIFMETRGSQGPAGANQQPQRGRNPSRKGNKLTDRIWSQPTASLCASSLRLALTPLQAKDLLPKKEHKNCTFKM